MSRSQQSIVTLGALGCVLLGLNRLGLILQRHDNLPGFIVTALQSRFRPNCSASRPIQSGEVTPLDRGCDLLGGDLILEVLGVETIEPALGRFRLRIHEEGNRRAA